MGHSLQFHKAEGEGHPPIFYETRENIFTRVFWCCPTNFIVFCIVYSFHKSWKVKLPTRYHYLCLLSQSTDQLHSLCYILMIYVIVYMRENFL